MSKSFRAARGVAVIASLMLASVSVWAQDYPNREIRSLCNFAAGSGADILVRWYSDRLSKLTGRPVLVENRVGAQGNIATDALAKAKPDGYTINIAPASSTLAAAPHLYKSLPFDPERDFTAVTTIARLTFVIAVDAAKPINNATDLVEHLKKRPDQGFYGTGNNTGMVAAALFKDMAGLKTTGVPYKTSVQALGDLLSGSVDFIAYDATWAVGQMRAGKLRIVGVTAGNRSPSLPNIPTMAEQGFAGYDLSAWWGVVVPAGTPKPIVDRLAGWFNEITNAADTKEFLSRVATDPLPGTPEQMSAMLKTETDKWARFVNLAKIERQ